MSQPQPGAAPDPVPDAPVAGPPCPLCHTAMVAVSSGIIAAETGAPFGVAQCPRCGLGRTDPVPDDLDPYYGPAYYGNRHGITARICIRRRLRIVRRHAGPAEGRALLDFGAGDGGFLRAAGRDGWDAWGVERDRPAAGPGDPRVVAGLDALGGRGPFACATFWHTLEHLDDPVGVLDQLRGLLAPGGLVLAAVPNFASRQARVLGASWLHLDLPRHLHHFTPPSLARAFQAAGYRGRVTAPGELEYDVIGWAQGLLDRGLGGRGEFFTALSGRWRGGASPRLAVQAAAGTALAALAVLPAWVEGRLGSGGTLLAVARAEGGQGARHVP